MRNAIYTKDFFNDEAVWNYRFSAIKPVVKYEASENNEQEVEQQDSDNKQDDAATFRIFKAIKYKEDGEDKIREFDVTLNLNAIRVKLFKFGVGMLVFETENYDTDNENDIILINEFGRRVYVPFIDENRTCKLCADEVSVTIDGKTVVKGAVSGAKEGKTDEITFSPLITYFLSNDRNKMTTKREKRRNEFYIEPIVDDRMFVACIYNNADFINSVCQWDVEKGEYRYLSDTLEYGTSSNQGNSTRRFYEMMFIDGDGLSCYNRTMLRSLINDHTYARWLELGTVTGISEYSMVCVTSGIEFLSLPFLTEYVEMIMVVLAQRAALLSLQRAMSESARQNGKGLAKIHDTYIELQSMILIPEVTEQQQGIELYNMMRKNLFVTDQVELIEKQINSAHENNTAKAEERENAILFWVAILGLLGIKDAVSGTLDEILKWWFDVPSISTGISVGINIVFILVTLWSVSRLWAWGVKGKIIRFCGNIIRWCGKKFRSFKKLISRR